MRIVQLIDSLEPGGAEKMAVTIANELANNIEFSGIVTTRKLGKLHKFIAKNVEYFHVNKKCTFDIRAIQKFRRYLKKNKVQLVHVHGTSALFAVLTKCIYPKVKIIWHDHNGNRDKIGFKNLLYKLLSLFFAAIIVVNEVQLNFIKKYFLAKKVVLLPNFISFENSDLLQTKLHGEDHKRIVMLANLREPKNHILMFKAFLASKIYEENWSLHLIGKDNKDEYSQLLKEFIAINKLENSIFIYGSCFDVDAILNQASVGVLTSTHEGFPVSLLEYGKHKLGVIASNVGFCPKLIENDFSGYIFENNNALDLELKIKNITQDTSKRALFSSNLHQHIKNNFSSEVIVNHLLNLYSENIEK